MTYYVRIETVNGGGRVDLSFDKEADARKCLEGAIESPDVTRVVFSSRPRGAANPNVDLDKSFFGTRKTA